MIKGTQTTRGYRISSIYSCGLITGKDSKMAKKAYAKALCARFSMFSLKAHKD